MKLTRIQEEACNLLSALATEWDEGDNKWSFGTPMFAHGEWSGQARELASDALTDPRIEFRQLYAYEQLAEAEALIRDGSVR